MNQWMCLVFGMLHGFINLENYWVLTIHNKFIVNSSFTSALVAVCEIILYLLAM